MEFATLAGNTAAVSILLKYGAKVSRTPKYLSMETPSALEAANGYPLLQRLLLLRAEVEQMELESKAKQRKVAEIKALEKLEAENR